MQSDGFPELGPVFDWVASGRSEAHKSFMSCLYGLADRYKA